MPRKSAAASAINAPASPSTRLKPPAILSTAERAVFADLVTANDAKHFRPSDLPLLCTYCEVIAMLALAAKELRKGIVAPDGRVSPWLGVQERGIKSMVALSMRLRLSPQARSPNNPGPRKPSSVYDEIRNRDYDD